MLSLRNKKLLFPLSSKLAHSLGCKLRSHCFCGWSCGVCWDAWLESGVTRQPKELGGLVSVTARSHLWLQPPAVQTKATGKHETHAVCLHWAPETSLACLFIKGKRVKKKNKYGNQSGSWQCDSSLWWVSAPFSLCMKLDQFSETAGGCAISNIGNAPD